MSGPKRILWVDPTRTTFVESFDGGKTVSVARRRTPDHTWGPPIHCQLDAESPRPLFVVDTDPEGSPEQ